MANILKGVSVDSIGGRHKLAACVPLPAPYTIVVCPIMACNFRCTYCTYSLRREDQPFTSRMARMPLASYEKMVRDIEAFPQPIKVFNLCGLGEPLLSPDLPEMIQLAAQCDNIETVECITNGALLTPPGQMLSSPLGWTA